MADELRVNPNCKTCWGKGFIIRTYPITNTHKEMTRIPELCHCYKSRKEVEGGRSQRIQERYKGKREISQAQEG